jgi:AhpC/TSA family
MSSSTVSSAPRGRFARSTYLVLLLLLTASVGLNVLLARRVRQLRTTLDAGPSRPAPLQVGILVPPIVAKGLDGQSQTIAYTGSDRPTVLYVFTPQCVWCARNMDNLKTLFKTRGAAERFIGVSLSPEGLTDYVRAHDLAIPVVTSLSSETVSTYRLGGTPQTLVISPEGRVLQNWAGAWTNKQKTDIEAFFHVNLPGIQLPASEPKSEAKHL